MKKILLIAIILFFVFAGMASAQNQNDEITLHFFYSKTCPHCHDEMILLNKLEADRDDIKIIRYDIGDPSNVQTLKYYYQRYDVPQEYYGATPANFIEIGSEKGKYFIGYDKKMDDSIIAYFDDLKTGNDETGEQQDDQQTMLPFSDRFNWAGFSPLALSASLGALDGFNACAMVALAFLLTLLIGTKSRKKIILMGGVFIFVSGLVYYIFIAAWLNLFLFLGYFKIITVAVAVIIILFALFLLKDYVSGVVCKICNVVPGDKESILTKAQRKMFAYAAKMTQAEMSLPLALAGIALVAAGVNLIELFCSIGLPLAYTRLLSAYGLPAWQYYFYLLVYVIFYMLDDFIIFMLAVITLRITKIGDKYLKAVKLISGIILLVLGLLFIFYPEFLTL